MWEYDKNLKKTFLVDLTSFQILRPSHNILNLQKKWPLHYILNHTRYVHEKEKIKLLFFNQKVKKN